MKYENYKDIKVLVCESDPFVRSIVCSLLRDYGYGTILTSGDGREAWNMICREKPDFVVTEWMIPGINGTELTRLIRTHQDSPCKFMPVILVTAFTSKRRILEARAAGISEFLAKPINPVLFAKRLEQINTNKKPFVKTATYFGPQYRDTRTTSVGGASNQNAQQAQKTIIPQSSLHKKIIYGKIAPNNIEKAKITYSKIKDSADTKTIFRSRINNAMDEARALLRSMEKRQDLSTLANIFAQIQANGHMFGYKIIEVITENLVGFIEALDEFTEESFEVMEAHCAAIEWAVNNNVKDPAHISGKLFVRELISLCERYRIKYNEKRKAESVSGIVFVEKQTQEEAAYV